MNILPVNLEVYIKDWTAVTNVPIMFQDDRQRENFDLFTFTFLD